MNKKDTKKIGLWHLVISTLGAAFGVQSHKIHEKDFQQSSPIPYIIAGIVFTALFILSLVFIVSLVID